MDNISNLISKINNCYDFASVYALEEDFNKVGLTCQSTVSNKMVLCKIVDNRPIAEDLAKDFIFIGHLLEQDKQIPDKLLKCIVEFISASASDPSHVVRTRRSWTDMPAVYGEKFLQVESEDVKDVVQNMSIEDKDVASNLLDAIKKFLNGG